MELGSTGPPNTYEDIVSAIGNTPLIKLNRITENLQSSSVWAKLERCNPGGSIKDRIALHMVLDAESKGLIEEGGTIIEATSGNTGVGLAMVAAQRGYRCIFTMPDKMSNEKITLLRAMGAEVHVCPTAVEKDDPRSYYEVAARLAREIPGAWYPDQYSHQSNPLAHFLSTGPEIWQQTEGRLTHLVATMGTGGTISGIARALRELSEDNNSNPPKIVGVDAVGSILKQWFEEGTLGDSHSYHVEGFGEDFIPSATDFSLIDEIHQVGDADCFRWARSLARSEGMFCGGSCGGAIKVALEIAKECDSVGQEAMVVVILPDAGNPYLSKFYNDDWLRENGWEPENWG
ncbi:MAG TPA: cysteine synthase family protein [Candidatus Thalassarchaeaceae archaeon]|nr:cysteine synthase family protein [Candidatus Thalassarchaeaceae archaeon]